MLRKRGARKLLDCAHFVQRLIPGCAARLLLQGLNRTQRRNIGADNNGDYRRKEANQFVWNLRKRVVNLVLNRRKVIACKPPVPDVADNAHDLDRLVAHCLKPKEFSNRVLLAKRVPRQVFVNDNNLGSADLVVFIEESAT